mgnify:CR=1 FL=1
MGWNPLSDAGVELVKSTVGKVVEKLTDKYLPASMSEKEKEEFKLKAQELTLAEIKANADAERVYMEDRKSAREREIAVKDRTPAILAYVSFFGFFGTLVGLMVYDIPEAARDPLLIMLGLLGAIVGGVVQYYFGSSSGSAQKTAILSRFVGK